MKILFSKTKYNDISFIKDGGWHFTNIKSAEKIDHKMKNFLSMLASHFFEQFYKILL